MNEKVKIPSIEITPEIINKLATASSWEQAELLGELISPYFSGVLQCDEQAFKAQNGDRFKFLYNALKLGVLAIYQANALKLSTGQNE